MGNYCTECHLRKEKWRKAKGKWEPIDFPVEHFITNRKDFCLIGYTQNPLTPEATQNAIRNKAEICPSNPYRCK